MPTDVLLFMTWKTYGGEPSLDLPWARRLVGLLPPLAWRDKADLIEIAVVPDHVHVIARSGRQLDIPRLAQRLKGASCRYMNLDRAGRPPLKWAHGYDVRSIGRLALPAVRAYFDRQASKHQFAWVLRWSEGMPVAAIESQ
jgi:REP element-mobilizing transposase RayT